MTAQYDGKDYPVTGNPAADKISMKKVDDVTSESTFKKDGKITATNVRKLSADGKTLTITSTGTMADGKPQGRTGLREVGRAGRLRSRLGRRRVSKSEGT